MVLKTTHTAGPTAAQVTFHGVSSLGKRHVLVGVAEAHVAHGWRSHPASLEFPTAASGRQLTNEIVVYDDMDESPLQVRDISVSDSSVVQCYIVPTREMPRYPEPGFEPRLSLLVTVNEDRHRNHWIELLPTLPDAPSLKIPVFVPIHHPDVWAKPAHLTIFGPLPQTRKIVVQRQPNDTISALTIEEQSLPKGVFAEMTPPREDTAQTLVMTVTKPCPPFDLRLIGNGKAALKVPVEILLD